MDAAELNSGKKPLCPIITFQIGSCSQELDRLCDNDRTLECLKRADLKDLGKPCRHVVFAEEKEEVMVNRADSTLMHKCSNEIRRHCDGRLG